MSREEDVRDAVERFVSRMRQDLDAHLEALSVDLLNIVRGDMRTSRVDLDRAAVDVARAVAQGGLSARHDVIARVVLAIRRLDDASTLRGILDALADGAMAEASRIAVLLVDRDTLRSYRHQGFAPGRAPIDLPISASAVLYSAATLRQTTVIPGSHLPPDPALPAFLRVGVGQRGQITPVVVDQTVVALVYAEGPNFAGADAEQPVWSDHVEVLVRHAASRLESVTSLRTVEVLNKKS
jgi:hypothetical protein